MKKTVKLLIINAAALYIAIAGGMYMAQRSFIYPADKRHIAPADVQHPEMNVVHVTTEDGLTLEGWHLAPREAGKPTLVWFHGNADHHAFSVYHVEPYLAKGYGVLLTEYRGYGGNAGQPTEQGLYKDARAWMKSLLDQGVKPQDIILMGQSLGTGVAVQMALEHPDMRALVLQSAYTSLPDVARKTYPYLPVTLLMKDQYRSIGKIAQIHMPVLILHGANDTLILPAQGRKLFAAANEPKSFVEIPNAGHNDMPAGPVAERVEYFLSGLATPKKEK